MAAWRNATLSTKGGDPLEPPKSCGTLALPRPSRTSTNAGVLRPADGSGIGPVYRPPAGPAVAGFVERYWSVCWSTDAPARREVITHPAFHLTVTTVDGRHRSILPRGGQRSDDPDLRRRPARSRPGGRGQVPAWRFHGADRPPGVRVHRSAGATRPAGAGLGRGPAARPRAAAPDDPDVAVAALDQLVSGLVPRRPPRRTRSCSRWSPTCWPTTASAGSRTWPRGTACRCARCNDCSAGSSGWGRSGCCSATGCTTRSPPSTPTRGVMADLAGLAASLGWSDQSHFTHDFTAAVGVSPHAYAARPV